MSVSRIRAAVIILAFFLGACLSREERADAKGAEAAQALALLSNGSGRVEEPRKKNVPQSAPQLLKTR